eukprot:CAMPEP_0119126784 /NCGR_PEP_ID=MMETSP1310-20130426/5571_1 /TAXON_ID=464262 /ORGANISM="Genus nov. species nov., Strain RCC2339" /LENGTH=1688 /DNA_ID=CAMNT_0007116969 /DNA_START=54 /DNA_END=5120 /DNA_ORIENTATION=+
MTVLQEVKQHVVDGRVEKDNFKIVYVAPMKALAAEMAASFAKRLGSLGLSVRELTGDMQLTKREIQETQMIITTPEKWDVISRKSNDNSLVQIVKLLIIDEVHLLHEERGPVIEAIVARTIRQVESSQRMIRLVGLSATLPNYKDVASFLRVNEATGLHYFDASYRPVPLKQTFVGVKEKNPFKRISVMNDLAFEKLSGVVRDGEQGMVFVHSRKDTVRTAEALAELAKQNGEEDIFANNRDGESQDEQQRGKRKAGVRSGDTQWAWKEVSKSRNRDLKKLFPMGLGIHHAGMLRSDRNLTEKLFSLGLIKILCCTATLAWGVNLPAHCVVIKGTRVYKAEAGGFVKLGMLDVMQIFGRAGRPQFDTEGEAMILTEHENLNHYLSLLSQQLPIESQFNVHLADNLNAEIVLGTVTNVVEAITWLSYTYLFVRMCRNPIAYGINHLQKLEDASLLKTRRKWIVNAAQTLHDCRMVRFDKESGSLSATGFGRAASHFYIKHETMRIFNENLNGSLSDAGLLHVLCQAVEFEQIRVREEESGELHRLKEECCYLEVRGGGPDNAVGKVSVLFQSFIARAYIVEFSLVSDTAFVADNAGRILRCMFEVALSQEWSSVAKKVLKFGKMLDLRCLPDAHPLRQFGILSHEIMMKLEGANLDLDDMLDMQANEISQLVRHPKMGGVIKNLAHQFPWLTMDYKLQPITREVLRLSIFLEADFQWVDKIHRNAERWWIWVEDPANHHIYHSELWMLEKKDHKDMQTLNFTIPVFEPLPEQYIVHAINDRWLGSVQVMPITFKHLILPEKFPPHSDLLDLQPLAIQALHNKEYEKIFKYSHFNPIQTQIFWTMFHTDKCSLVGAPTGSGKTVAAELAILRVVDKNRSNERAIREWNQTHGADERKKFVKEKVVYIGPMKALVHERVKDWKRRFQDRLKVSIVELTGEASPSPAILHGADILCTTPEKWDGTSRQWHARDYVRATSLIIFDEIHLLGQDRGPILEVIVSRMRYIATQTGRATRLLGLSTALANASDLGDWLGVERSALFNFRPSVRPVPLETHVQGFPGQHYCPRMATMNKPTYTSICTYSRNKPVLVFVASRRQTRLTAQDLISLSNADENPPQFMNMKDLQLQKVLDVVKDSALRDVIPFGIGIHHAGLNGRDRTLVEQLFLTGKIQVLVCTATLAWGVNLPAHLVVIKGTEYYDAKTKRYVDFPITDVLQMMGRAGRPQFDNEGKACVFVHAPKKNFYKKFLYSPFPVESALLQEDILPDHVNAEIAAGTIVHMQDGVDYLTWTFFYRRLLRNPSFYGLEEATPKKVAEFLSEIMENCCEELEESGCIEVERDDHGKPLEIYACTAGRIAAYYYLSHKTISLFSSKLGETEDETAYASAIPVHELLDILCGAEEYEQLPVRHNEDLINSDIAANVRYPPPEYAMDDPHTKAALLFMHHFSRLALPISDYYTDLKSIIDNAVRIIQAMVDVASNGGRLFTALNCMHLMQMLVQARWADDSSILCLPFTERKGVMDRLVSSGLVSLAQVLNSSVDKLQHLLCENGKYQRGALTRKQFVTMVDVFKFYPDMHMVYKMRRTSETTEEGEKEETGVLDITLRRGPKGCQTDDVYSPKYPKKMRELWWIVLGDATCGDLLATKRVNVNGKVARTSLTFDLPEEAGDYTYYLYLISGTYMGLDQQLPVHVTQE